MGTQIPGPLSQPLTIGTQTITLTDTNWNWETPRIFGLLGNLSIVLSDSENLLWCQLP